MEKELKEVSVAARDRDRWGRLTSCPVPQIGGGGGGFDDFQKNNNKRKQT